MRLFIALDLGREIEKECERLQELLPEKGITKTRRYHLTLAFLGEVQPAVMEKVKYALQTISQKKFMIQTTSLGVFPSKKYPRVIWVGVDSTQELYELQKAIDDVLKPLHLPTSNDFHPHITLARVKLPEQRNELLEKVKTISVTKIVTSIIYFILFESIHANGKEYKELLRVSLQ